MNALLLDIRFAFRLLHKNPGFTLMAVLILSLGIGMTTTIFSVVNASLLNAFPYTNPGRLVSVWEESDEEPESASVRCFSGPNLVDCRNASHTFQDMAPIGINTYTMRYSNVSETVRALHVTSNLFALLGVQPALGRAFTVEEDKEGNNQTVILTDRFWEKRFQRDPGVLGKTILLRDKSYSIAGVMPSEFIQPVYPMFKPDILIPFGLAESNKFRDHRRSKVVARLRDDTGLQEAQAELDVIGRRLEKAYPEKNRGYRLVAKPLRAEYSRETSHVLYLLMGSSVLFLVVACANVANLLLLRGYQRRHEIALRTAMGAGRLRILRQLIVDGILLATLSLFAGTVLSVWGADIFKPLISNYIATVGDIGIDVKVLSFAAFFAILSGTIFGLIPAFQTWKTGISTVLKSGSIQATAGIQVRRVYSFFVLSQIALAFILIAGAGLATKTFSNLLRIDPGFNPDNVLTLWLDFPKDKDWMGKSDNVHEALLTQIRSMPGVVSVAVSDALPLIDQGHHFSFDTEDHPVLSGGYDSYSSWISSDYFRTLDIPLLVGRDFSEADFRNHGQLVTIVNRALAGRFWPSDNPIGKRLQRTGSNHAYEIIGVVENERYWPSQFTGKTDIAPRTFFPRYSLGYANLMVRAKTDPLILVPAVKAAVRDLDDRIVIRNVQPMNDVVREIFGIQYLTMLLVGIFALFAFILSSIGIFSVMAYAARCRTKEIAIRIAVGARRRDILRMILKQGITIIVLGVSIGLIGMLLLSRFIVSFVYGVAPLDLTILIGSLVLSVSVSIVACYIPASRVAKADPLSALRSE